MSEQSKLSYEELEARAATLRDWLGDLVQAAGPATTRSVETYRGQAISDVLSGTAGRGLLARVERLDELARRIGALADQGLSREIGFYGPVAESLVRQARAALEVPGE